MIFLSKTNCALKYKYGNNSLKRGRGLANIICIPKHVFTHHTSSQHAVLKMLSFMVFVRTKIQGLCLIKSTLITVNHN